MKKTLIIAALAATVSTGAFAQSASVTQTAVVGPQSNIQTGDHNFGLNSANIDLNANASAYSSRLYPGVAATAQTAQTGPQLNLQSGYGNFGLNSANINLNANAETWGSGNAFVGQAGLTTSQVNDQFGIGNVGVNTADIYTNGNAYANSYIHPVKKPAVDCTVAICKYDPKLPEMKGYIARD